MTQNLDRFKFRVWVRKYNGIKYNKMHYSYRMEYNYAFPNRDNHICIDTGTTNLDASKKFTMINNEGCQFSDRNSIVLMQSTGLKDKNGNLIYEGDIVKWLERKYVITWIDDEACFKAISIDNEIITTLKLHEHCEVLGNKFENPELLK